MSVILSGLQRRDFVGFQLPAGNGFGAGGRVRTGFCFFLKLRLTLIRYICTVIENASIDRACCDKFVAFL